MGIDDGDCCSRRTGGKSYSQKIVQATQKLKLGKTTGSSEVSVETSYKRLTRH